MPPAGPSVDSRPRGRPANASTADTVEVVLTAARRSFAARGYAATSNRQVAEAAGLAHTAIYNHFGSKAQLFTAVFLDVQNRLVDELDRSARAAPDQCPLPRALLDAIESLRAADPSYVEFLASMYVEVRRVPELRSVFHGGVETFPVVDRLRELSPSGPEGDDDLWFWIAFALGLAQLGALADADTFESTVAAFRRRLATGAEVGAPPPLPTGGATS